MGGRISTRTMPWVAVATLVAASLAGAQPPGDGGAPLETLTVPADRLPEACSLPVVGERGRAASTAPLPDGRVSVFTRRFPPGVDSNPWVGSDRRAIVSIRRRMEAARPLPDLPATTPEANARYQSRLADGVDEAYVAFYETGGTRSVTVLAVRFTERSEALRTTGLGPSVWAGQATRIRIGDIAVTVDGESGPCRTAIETYLRSL